MAVAGMVGVSSIEGYEWCEVDDLMDFAHAEKTVKRWRQHSVKRAPGFSKRDDRIQQKVA
jgi:hypothetical protein